LVFLLARVFGWLTGVSSYALLLKMSFWQTIIYWLLNTLIIVLAGQFFYQAKKGRYVEIA